MHTKCVHRHRRRAARTAAAASTHFTSPLALPGRVHSALHATHPDTPDRVAQPHTDTAARETAQSRRAPESPAREQEGGSWGPAWAPAEALRGAPRRNAGLTRGQIGLSRGSRIGAVLARFRPEVGSCGGRREKRESGRQAVSWCSARPRFGTFSILWFVFFVLYNRCLILV